jgi:bifunctional DNA-binding transcriptional regulator/antitoxin component of YhaV-PrlF toxin-antitoxin module
MAITVSDKTGRIVVPPRIQRQAGFKPGDRLQFRVVDGTITIKASERTYKPTEEELAAMREGQAAIDRGDFVTLSEYSDELDRKLGKSRVKRSPKVSP